MNKYNKTRINKAPGNASILTVVLAAKDLRARIPISKAADHLLSKLITHCNPVEGKDDLRQEYECYISHTRLAEITGYCRKTVVTAIQELRDADLVSTWNLNDNRRQTVLVYQIRCQNILAGANRNYQDVHPTELAAQWLHSKAGERECALSTEKAISCVKTLD